MAILAIGIGIGVLGPLVEMLIPKYDDRGCSTVAYQIQEAANCAAFPHSWKRLEEIAKLYDRGEFSCPTDVERGVSLGLSLRELRKIGQWIHQNKPLDRNDITTYGHVYDYWLEVRGVKFCTDAEFRGWLR